MALCIRTSNSNSHSHSYSYSYNSCVPSRCSILFLCCIKLQATHTDTTLRKMVGGAAKAAAHSRQPNLTCTLRYVTDVVASFWEGGFFGRIGTERNGSGGAFAGLGGYWMTALWLTVWQTLMLMNIKWILLWHQEKRPPAGPSSGVAPPQLIPLFWPSVFCWVYTGRNIKRTILQTIEI